jgi:hypothetical protein
MDRPSDIHWRVQQRGEPAATRADDQRRAAPPYPPAARAESDRVPVFGRRPGPSRHSGERALEAEATEPLMAKKTKKKKKNVPNGGGSKKKR